MAEETQSPHNRKYRTYISNFLPMKIADFFKYPSVVRAIKAIITDSGGGGGGVTDGYVDLWQGAQFDKVNINSAGQTEKLYAFLENDAIPDGTVFMTNIDLLNNTNQKMTLIIKDSASLGGFRIQLLGANKETFALPMFYTVENQTNYTFTGVDMENGELTSLIIETNPLDVAGDAPEAAITGNELIIPPQSAGQRVYAVFKK